MFILSVLLFFGNITFAQKATDDFTGKWRAENGKTILITKAGDTFTGVGVEKKIEVLSGLKYSGGKWKGILTRPKDGTKLDCEVLLEGNKLKITVYKRMISKTTFWVKEN